MSSSFTTDNLPLLELAGSKGMARPCKPVSRAASDGLRVVRRSPRRPGVLAAERRASFVSGTATEYHAVYPGQQVSGD